MADTGGKKILGLDRCIKRVVAKLANKRQEDRLRDTVIPGMTRPAVRKQRNTRNYYS